MRVKTVAILSPGDMGHSVGGALVEHGLDVITCLAGRSERTRGLARAAGFRDVPSYEELVGEADLLLSILVPARAAETAQAVAEAIRTSGSDLVYADCNAVSPMTSQEIGSIVTSAGGGYIDASIIGGPPGRGAAPRFYASGPDTGPLGELDGKGIEVKPMGLEVGRASAIKMCYAGLTKGTSALHVAVLTAAASFGVSNELEQEFSYSQPDTLSRMRASVPHVAIPAARWIGEMEEIAASFEHAGSTAHFHQGAADIFRLLSRTPLAAENPEDADSDRTLEETIEVFVREAAQPTPQH